MIFSKIGYPPYHFYCWVDTQFTHSISKKFQPAMVVGLTSIPGRTWGFSVIFSEGGAMYRQIPPHALAFCSNPKPNWSLDQSQLWNCYSDSFTVVHNPILKGMRMSIKIQNEIHLGEYLFHSTHLFDGWSSSPEQDKEFYFVKLDNGRLTIQPTNRIVFLDSSFVETNSLPSLKLNETIYSCSEKFQDSH
jgi:hypothetical protein